MLIGSIVMVIVEHPDGCPEVNVYGDVGVITEIKRRKDGEYDYIVHTETNDYCYWTEQIREMTDEEIKLALYNLLMR